MCSCGVLDRERERRLQQRNATLRIDKSVLFKHHAFLLCAKVGVSVLLENQAVGLFCVSQSFSDRSKNQTIYGMAPVDPKSTFQAAKSPSAFIFRSLKQSFLPDDISNGLVLMNGELGGEM